MDNVTINITENPVSVTVTVLDGATPILTKPAIEAVLIGECTHDHSKYILHSLATAANDFLVASGVGVFIKKTLAEVKIILGLGTAAYTASTDYATSGHTHTQSNVSAVAFQTPVFANPLALDAATYKDFKCGIITGATTVNLSNAVDGDAGMIELIIDGVGGYAVALGVMFTKKLGATSIVNTLNADNFISWRKVGTDIVYTVVQKV